MRIRKLLPVTGLLALLVPQFLPAQIRTNAAFRANSIPRNDDGSSPIVPLGWELNFFGVKRTAAFVNNNGNITFDAALPTYTPFGLTGVNREIIAVFFSDVDTRDPKSNLVTYGRDTIDGRRAFGVNYVDVGYYNQHADKLNSFQLVLIERPDTGDGNFDIEFNYERIQWETGDASGGTGGRGGVSAAVGWSNGSGIPGTYYEAPGSLIPGSFLDGGAYSLRSGRTPGSSRQNGRWVFRARGGTVIPSLSITQACPLPNATAGRLFAHTFQATGSRPPYRWSIAADPDSTLPNFSMAQQGVLSGTPAAPGTYEFTVRVSTTDEDGEITVAQRCSVTVDPPAISFRTNSVLPTASEGQRYETRLTAEGGGGPFRFTMLDSFGVPGLTLRPDGVLTGVPFLEGAYHFQVMASSDARDRAVPSIKRFTLNVRSLELVTRASCPLPNATGGAAYSYQFQALGGSPPYNWSAVGTLPPGLSLGVDGRLSGTPRVPHWWPFSVKVEDSAGRATELGCGLVVLFPEVQVANACPLPSATTGAVYSHRLNASGGSGPYTWSVVGSLPQGLRLFPEGALEGTPLVTGASQFRLKATDSRGQTSETPCSLVVNRGVYAASACPLPSGYTGESYGHTLSASGGAEPYFWSATSLPAGLRLSPDGHLSGSLIAPGSYPVSVRVTDRNGQVASSSCNITVRPQALRLNNPCELLVGTLGRDYSQTLTAAGGIEPYSFTVRGIPPAGVQLSPDGTLSGTPMEPGLFPVEFTVTDRTGRSSSSICAIVVGLPELPAVRITGLPAVLAPASGGPSVAVELASAYPLPVDGEVTLVVEADTNSPTGAVNRSDPAVRFSNGQRTVPFSIPAGSRQATVQIQGTGTVASVVTVSASRLSVGGLEFQRQATAVTKVNRLAPVLTNVCYEPNSEGFDLDVSGYTTTRDLLQAELVFGSNSYRVDLTAAALEYFSGDESVRTGGAFRVRAPYRLSQGTVQALGQGTAVIGNSVGASPSRPIQRCQ